MSVVFIVGQFIKAIPWALFLLTLVGTVHLRTPDNGNVSQPTGACRNTNDTVQRCIFTHLHNAEDFKNIQGENIRHLEIYFKTDILRGVLPDKSFSKFPHLNAILIHGHYPRHISSGAFSGLTHVFRFILTRHLDDSFLFININGGPAVQIISAHQRLDLTGLVPPTFGMGWLDPLISIKYIDLRYNNITSFPRGQFCKLQFLTILNLAINDFSTMEDIGLACNESQENSSACYPCEMLQTLQLSGNSISELKGWIACNSSNLRQLYMNHNTINFISERFFSCHGNLEEISLDGNLLNGDMLVKAGIGDVSGLKSLSLSGNSMPVLSPTILHKMIELNEFYCNNCGMQNISGGTFQNLQKLSKLLLNNNNLNIQGSDTFKALTSVTHLELAGNGLMEFDTSIVLPTLIHLGLERNQLQRIPDLAGPWHSMNHLDLSFNNISTFEFKRLSGLIHLITLVMNFNHISHLRRGSFSWGRDNLEEIAMGNNSIIYVDVYALEGALALTKISFEYNQLPEISGWIRQVNEVNLKGNKIKIFDSRYFPRNIQTIDLSWNQISKINEAISQLPVLRTLNLSYNKLHKLRENSFAMIPALVPRAQVFLEGNWLHCDCHLDWLKKINSIRSLPEVPDLNLVYCETPMTHANRSFTSLSAWDLTCPYKTECNIWQCTCCDQDVIGGCKCLASCYDQCECFHKHDQSINVVNCSSRSMSFIPPKRPIYVQTARFDNNNLISLAPSMFNFPHMKQLFLNKSHVSYIQPGTFRYMDRMQVLYLQDNDLVKVEKYTLSHLTILEILYLHNNKMQNIEGGSFAHLFFVEIMSLHNNSLTHMDLDLFEHMESLEDLTLHGNPWRCDCQFGHEFHKWLVTNSKIISNIKAIHCHGPHGFQPIIEMDFFFCTKKQPVIELVSMAAVFVIVAFLVVVVHKNRILLTVMAYNRFGVRLRQHSEDHDNLEKPYDVFIGRSEHDDDFAFVYFTLLPELETATGPQNELAYKVCEEWRNWPVGAGVHETIIKSVEQSKRTILLISEHYFESVRAQYVFTAAHNQALNDGQQRLILVLLDAALTSRMDQTMTLYMKTGLTLAYGEPNFWGKLRYHLADNPRG